eukprot:TRINITY_DN5487_c0_g1_i5.p1 TRINITY_DN5487_c0_g1~~TRINITY_DN5487_c0_g1_i5.p1  ORF type:complete len:448 (-),score=92.07 TRINITY_DN5487_c0_g1_i5:160-1503(-)
MLIMDEPVAKTPGKTDFVNANNSDSKAPLRRGSSLSTVQPQGAFMYMAGGANSGEMVLTPEQTQRVQEIEMQRKELAQKANEAETVAIESFGRLRKVNDGVLQEKEEELGLLKTILDNYNVTLKKIEDENQYFAEQLKRANEKRDKMLKEIGRVAGKVNEEVGKSGHLFVQYHESIVSLTGILEKTLDSLKKVQEDLASEQSEAKRRNAEARSELKARLPLEYVPKIIEENVMTTTASENAFFKENLQISSETLKSGLSGGATPVENKSTAINNTELVKSTGSTGNALKTSIGSASKDDKKEGKDGRDNSSQKSKEAESPTKSPSKSPTPGPRLSSSSVGGDPFSGFGFGKSEAKSEGGAGFEGFGVDFSKEFSNVAEGWGDAEGFGASDSRRASLDNNNNNPPGPAGTKGENFDFGNFGFSKDQQTISLPLSPLKYLPILLTRCRC